MAAFEIETNDSNSLQAQWEHRLAADGLQPIEGPDTFGVPPELSDVKLAVEENLGEAARPGDIANDVIVELQAAGTRVSNLGYRRWKDLEGVLSVPSVLLAGEVKVDLDSVAETLEDESARGPFEIAASALLPSEIEKLLAPLGERERQILALRFGLDRGGSPRTLEEVGEYFNLTRERVREIDERAMGKLRHPELSSKSDFLSSDSELEQ